MFSELAREQEMALQAKERSRESAVAVISKGLTEFCTAQVAEAACGEGG
jgi:hypothetical protein